MKQVVNSKTSRIKKIISKFPELKRIVLRLNQKKINWALAAGSAYFFYTGDEEALDDVDIWVSRKDKKIVSNILSTKWVARSSERHRAENIELGKIDLFTNCRKIKGDRQLLDYHWTKNVTSHLRKTVVDEIEYSIISPEDVALLKIANPRGKKEMRQVEKMLINGDKEYFNRRKEECEFKESSGKNL